MSNSVIKFKDAIAALEWSEEMLARVPVKSQIAKIMQGVLGSGEFTMEELRDQALVISMATARIKPHAAKLMILFLFGRDDSSVFVELTNDLVARASEYCPEARGRNRLQVQRLVVACLLGHRKYIQFNKPMSRNIAAKAVGVSHVAFNKGAWVNVMLFIREACNNLLAEADKQLTASLEERRMLA